MELSYVSYELAKKLKKLGFPQDYKTIYATKDCWSEDGDYRNCHHEGDLDYSPSGYCAGEWIEAPTLELVSKWLREEEGIFICIGIKYDKSCFYEITINKKVIDCNDGFSTYEEALEKGIEKAIEILEHRWTRILKSK